MTIIRSNSISGINSITAQASSLAFYDSTGASLSLDTGNVSAGVITATTLRVTGDLTVEGTTTTLDTVVTEVDKLEVSANNSTVGVAITQSGSGDILRLYDGASQVVTVTDGGNLLVGANDAGGWLTKIQVADNASYQSAFNITNNVNADLQFEIKSNESRFGPSTNTPLVFKNGGGERLRIDSSGNVGIGTDDPNNTSKLHIYDGSAGCDLTITSGNVNAVDINLGDIDDHDIGRIRYNNSNDSMTFNTNGDERLRIASDGNVTLYDDGSSTPSASPTRLSLGSSHSNNGGENPKFDLWAHQGNYMSMGVSSDQMDFMMSRDNYDFVWYGQNDADNGPEERMRIDNSEKTLDFPSSAKIRLRGSQNAGQRHAHINIGSDGGTNTDTRAIDIWGAWQDQESKSITYIHASTTNNIVAQQRVRYNSTPSSTYYEIGRFYHGQDTSAYPIRFVSTSTTTANLELDGNLKVPSGNGIDFSATSDAAGMTSELLDDYEEGTFTPTLRGSSTAGTATGTIGGRYIKIGHFVHVSIRINNVNFSGSGGSIRIDGLPYAVASASNSEYSSAASHMIYNITFDTNYKHGWYANPGSSSMYGIQSRSGQVWQDWASSNFHSSSIYMNQTITYMAA